MAKQVNDSRNPMNAKHVLYQRLTRLFSGPIVNYRSATEKALKRRQYGKFSQSIRSTEGKTFKKQYFNFYESLQSSMFVNVQRNQRYQEFNTMEYMAEVGSVLDVYSEEMTVSSKMQPMLSINCPNEEIKEVLKVLYYDIMNIEFNLPGWCRGLCKYGDQFLYLDIEEGQGIKRTIGLPPADVERLEGTDKTNPDYVQFEVNAGGLTLENWQVAHFRILGNDKFAPYGQAILDPARRIYRQLDLIEQAMMAYRVVRSPERRVFYIDIGNIPPQDVEQFMQQVMTSMKKNQMVDASDGTMNLSINPMPISYLTKIPLLDGRNITIEQVSKEYKEGKDLWVYSIDDKTNKMVPGKVKWCGKNYSANKIIKVWLDDNSYVMTAPEHPFVRRNGKSVRADQLIVGDSLMPFYRKENYYGYEKVYDPSKDKYVNTHRMVAENVYKDVIDSIESPLCVHHKNPQKGIENRFDNSPDNLEFMNFWDHRKMHYEHCELTLNRPEQLKKTGERDKERWNKDEVFRKKTIERFARFNNSPEHDIVVQKLIQYNNSELHKQHNVIRSKNKKSMWENKERREKAIESMKIKFDSICMKYITEEAKKLKEKVSMDKFCDLIKNNVGFVKQFVEINKKTKRDILSCVYRQQLRGWLQKEGYLDFYDFLQKVNTNDLKFRGGSRKKINHKVSKIEILDFPLGHDVYCMTITGPNGEGDRHNFAICSESGRENEKNCQVCGIIVKNSVTDDFYLPVRGGTSGTKIESLPGGSYVGDIDDVKYLRDKLFTALKVPASYISRGDGADEDKSSLAQKDVRFARTIQRLQKSVISELTKIGLIHLYVLGYRNEDLISFDLSLNNPSKIAELQELELWKTKFEVASSATENFFSKRWIAEKIFNISEEEFLRCQREMYYDKWVESQFSSLSEGGGEGGGGGGGDLGDLGGEDLGGEELESPTDEEGGKESILLASPDEEGSPPPSGKKNEPYLTPKAKGKLYYPESFDKRDMGARKRSYESLFSKEMGSNTPRNIFKGYGSLKSLAKGISESKETNYNEEDSILNTNYEIKQILEKLEEKYNKKESK